MTTIKAFIKSHPVLAYYILTLAISSGGVLLVIGGPGGIPATAEQFERLLPIAIPVQLAGPSVAGLLLTGLVYGRVGFRDLFSRLLRWRVAARECHPRSFSLCLSTGTLRRAPSLSTKASKGRYLEQQAWALSCR